MDTRPESTAQPPSTFTERARAPGLAALLGIVGSLLRQLLIVAFIATGLVAGTDLPGLLQPADPTFVLTETGIAVALTFSSTIIIVKLLSDKREVDPPSACRSCRTSSSCSRWSPCRRCCCRLSC